MPNNIIEEIDKLHSLWLRMDKTAKLSWLSGEKVRLTNLANQFAQYICYKGGVMNDTERAYARKLLEMTDMVNDEGSKIANDLLKEAFNEFAKSLVK